MDVRGRGMGGQQGMTVHCIEWGAKVAIVSLQHVPGKCL